MPLSRSNVQQSSCSPGADFYPIISGGVEQEERGRVLAAAGRDALANFPFRFCSRAEA